MTEVDDDADKDLESLNAELVADSEITEGLVARMSVDVGGLSGDTLTRIYVEFSCAPVELLVRMLGANGRGENWPDA